MNAPASHPHPSADTPLVALGVPGPIGLVLTGGGARAAYQVGALLGIRRILLESRWPQRTNPFRIVCGTSAGALNAAALAAGADDLFGAIARLGAIWGNVEPAQVYRSDIGGALGNAGRWVGNVGLGWLVRKAPRSLFDNSPLESLLVRTIDFERLQKNLAQGHLDSLAIGASSYSSGHHITFYQSRDARPPWVRSQRVAYPTTIGVRHLMASAALPFLFPAIPLVINGRREFCGDGSMRQMAPTSPVVHLGADRILVIGSAQLPETVAAPGAGAPPAAIGRGTGEGAVVAGARARGGARDPVDPSMTSGEYPSLAEVGSHMLASIFFDALASDLERIKRINRTLSLMPPAVRAHSPLRVIETLVIAPSRPLDQLAVAQVSALPTSVRALLRVAGARREGGAGIGSYLLFDRSYTRRLMALGRRDALDQAERIKAFFEMP